MAVLDFGTLQDILANLPNSTIPSNSEDGVFARLGQILLMSQQAGRLVQVTDFIPLIRHVLRRQSLRSGQLARLRVPTPTPWPGREQWSHFGVRAHSQADGLHVIEALPWQPAWLAATDIPVFEDVFAEASVRLDWHRPIDPFLSEASGFQTYVSPGQREAVRSAFLLPDGETLIVGLPTGSGKSFVAQAPVLVRGLEGGLTVCVVPTTALVLDQARQMSRLLKRRYPHREVPSLAWYAGLTADERGAIKTAIREGRQGILYCSPEAVTGALLPALYDCARAGLLEYLIVDEAHLVSQWGDGFRPAFQMLAGVRRGLLSACPSAPFKTILMSATLTPDTIDTIDALFGPARTVQMVSSVHLRPEPQYWIHREDDAGRKEQKVLEVLRHAPRPFVLYVTKRSDAERWFKTLKTVGLKRLDCFHGETGHADRLRIINAWSDNQLDGIVATSAFGVGIDKRDVRTIIHAAVPETLDRFYQEVGRGGRDGCPSASFLIYSKEDQETANQIGSPALISEELAFERWAAMFASAERLDPLGQLLQLDLSIVPPRLRQESDYNESWNMRTLIMMARAKMLELESLPPARIAQQENETAAAFDLRSDEHWNEYFRHTVVRILEYGHQDRETFDRAIREERMRSFGAASDNRTLLNQLLSGTVEISGLLDHLYRSHAPGRSVIVSRACGGCPDHRARGQVDTAYVEPPAFGIERVTVTDTTLWHVRFPHLDLRAPIVLPLAESRDDELTMSVLTDLVAMFGVTEVAVPSHFRAANVGLSHLHRHATGGILLLQDIEEEKRRPSAYELPRATVWTDISGQRIPQYLFTMNRPLHIILAPASTRDPWHLGRRLSDSGSNLLPFDVFKLGARA